MKKTKEKSEDDAGRVKEKRKDEARVMRVLFFFFKKIIIRLIFINITNHYNIYGSRNKAYKVSNF